MRELSSRNSLDISTHQKIKAIQRRHDDGLFQILIPLHQRRRTLTKLHQPHVDLTQQLTLIHIKKTFCTQNKKRFRFTCLKMTSSLFERTNMTEKKNQKMSTTYKSAVGVSFFAAIPIMRSLRNSFLTFCYISNTSTLLFPLPQSFVINHRWQPRNKSIQRQ